MAAIARVYNSLPTLGQADEQFVDREAILHTLATLLAQYQYTFGLCLVHTHCTLAEGEIMLASGNVSEPKLMEHAPTIFPERWLSTGEPYEFTDRLTEKPPAELVDEFQRIAENAKLQNVLGLYHIDRNMGDTAIIEWTEGRKNLTREITDEDKAGEPVQTAWDFGRGDPVTMSCVIYCDTRNTRGTSVHKNTRSHV